LIQRKLSNGSWSTNPESLADPAKGRAFYFWYNLMAAGELEVMEMVFKKSQPGRSLPALPAQREIFLRAWIEQIPAVRRAFTAASATRFHFNALAFSHKKCFFSTENGYFDTAPDPLPTPVEAGDQIAAVGGLEMPLLLRPVEGGYRLLTHVYVPWDYAWRGLAGKRRGPGGYCFGLNVVRKGSKGILLYDAGMLASRNVSGERFRVRIQG
jgi:hypothetical protein